MFPLLVEVSTMLILPHFIPPGQETIHCIKHVGIRVSVANFDVDQGVGLSVP